MSPTERSIPLPQAGPSKPLAIAHSKNGPRRAIVLGLVHVLILIHVAHWLLTGRTATPVEPSESMETLELGLVNAGAIFFGLAILSTFVFGRFMCGWGCHVVALQDLCAWMMKKIGVRPKPFRSRLLVFVPLLLALYMFVWPALKRWVVVPLVDGFWPTVRTDLRVAAPNPDGFTAHLTTSDFWATFPGLAIAVPFLLICGFACVYFLGAKGFCTYGCPYGGFFAPADRFSIGKIVVDHDRCSGCGHCTAVCTSNVRVHEEIKAFGSVVDPGCMKCMDCVSVCPTDALSFRFAKPSVGRSPVSKVARHYDSSLREDVALLAVFALAFFATRGLYGLIPLLMAMGIAACVTFLAWKAWRVVRDQNARIIGAQLRLKGRLTTAGAVFLLSFGAGIVLLAHSAAINSFDWRSSLEARRLAIPKQVALAGAGVAFDQNTRDSARRIVDRDAMARRLGLVDRPDAVARAALMHLVLGESSEAETLLRGLVSRGNAGDELIADLGRIIQLDPQRSDEALTLYEESLARNPEQWAVREAWSLLMFARGEPQAVIDESEDAIDAMAGRPLLARARARTLLTRSRAERVFGLQDQSLATLALAVDEYPHSAVVRENYAAAMFQIAGDAPGAVAQLERAVHDAPHDPQLRFQLGRIRLIAGDPDGALDAFNDSLTIDPSPERRTMISVALERAQRPELLERLR